MRKLRKPSDAMYARTLHTIIDELPSPDVDNTDLKGLILQLLMEIGPDQKHFASHSKCKLEALRLLSDIVRNDDVGSYETDLLDILATGDDK